MQHESAIQAYVYVQSPRLLAYHNKRPPHTYETYSGPCSPLLGKILEDALFSSFAAKFQELHAQTMKYTCVVMLMFPHYEERRNQTKLHDYSPAQNHFHSPIQMLQIIRLYLKSGLYSSRCIRETHPHFCHRQDVESKDVRIFTFGDDYLFTYIEEMNRFLSAGGGVW